MAQVSPTVRTRELGMRLRQLRTGGDLTVEEVADKLLCSPTKVSRMETGARRPTLRDVRDLCTLYNVGPEESDQLMQLAREARQQGWWTHYDDLKIPQLIGLEQEATAITCFTTFYVPALFQTEEYATAIIKGIAPRIDPNILRQRVEARIRRQRLLDQPRPPRYRALLDEAALHRAIGGSAVMYAQLGKIMQIVHEEKATVQVLPYGVGAYSAADSNFTFLEFGDSTLPGVVFVEGLVSQLYLEKPSELARYAESLEYLRDAALTPRDSINYVAEIHDQLAGRQ